MKVRFTTAARNDITRIHKYIARESPVAAAKVVSAIERSTNRLAVFPLSGRIGAIETTRELVVPQLPFVAVYRLTTDAVEVFAVFHTAKDNPHADTP